MSKETMSMVERVARAIMPRAWDNDGPMFYAMRAQAFNRAVAAIKAMSDVAPVAWIYLKPDNGKDYNYDKLLREHRCPACVIEGWTEIPLHILIDAALPQE